MAPLPIKVKYSEKIFEQSPDFVKHVLAGWVELHPELAELIYNFLIEKEWKLLPLAADRSKLSGILPTWPEKDDFGSLTDAFVEAHPEYTEQTDDVTLMIVWISNRLPVELKDPMEWEYDEESK